MKNTKCKTAEKNAFKLKEGKLKFDVGENFSLRVVRPQPRLPWEVVNASTLEVFKAKLDTWAD